MSPPSEVRKRFAAMAEAGTTLLVSSHVMEEASHCSSLLLLLRNGQLLERLTPAELAERGGSTDLEQAFLSVIRTAEGAPEPDPAAKATKET